MTREFITLRGFDKAWKSLGLNDDDLIELQVHLCKYPESGDVIEGTGGLRKLRWQLKGTGKSKGARVLYVDFFHYEKIYLITAFGKSEKTDITKSEKAVIKKKVTALLEELRSKKYDKKKYLQ